MASIAAFLWFVYDKIQQTPSILSGTVLAATVLILSSAYVYSIRVRTENIALRSISEIFFDINQIYKNKLRENFGGECPVTNPEDLLAEEKLVLSGVCQRIENIYSRVINRNCMVTVKLVTQENDRLYAHTYVRSQDLCDRDNPSRIKYAVQTGENTAFDEALKKRPDHRPPHFFSADLVKDEKEGRYSNQRQHFERYYKSAIVVPIRGANKGKEATSSEFDLVGFLCIDTLSVNHLNSGYHLYMLSALASQMYNFISLMRGKYIVVVG